MRLGKLFLAGAMATFFLAPFFASAMSLKPESVDIAIKPGTPVDQSIEIRNTSRTTQSYEVLFMNVSFADSADDLTFANLSEAQSSWFSTATPTFSLQPNELRSVSVQIAIPASDVASAMTIAVLIREKSEAGSGIAISSAATSLLFLHIGEGLMGKIHLLSFDASPHVTLGNSVTLNGLFENTGTDTAVLPNIIVVTDMFGREVDRIGFSDSPKRLPVGTTRSLTAGWPEDLGAARLFFGQYTFSLYDGDKLYGQTSVFLFSPLPVIALLVFCLIILGILLSARKRLRS